MMSETASREVTILPESERMNACSIKDSFSKTHMVNTGENIEGKQCKSPASLVETPNIENGVVNGAMEVVVTEVEYVESDDLNDVENVDATLKVLLAGLESKDWVLLCETLNDVRRLSIFHKEAMQDILDNVISLVVKSLKNPRSAVCKTAIMTSADIFKAYGDHIIDSLDPLLVQLLLKASQDKRFVCEAAVKALIAMTTWISPVLLLPKLLPNLKNRNPRIRAKASMCFSRSVPQLGAEGIKSYGIDKLMQIVVAQLSDQLPESREVARTLLQELRIAYDNSPVLIPNATSESEDPETQSWDQFCQSNLSPLNAQAVIRVTSTHREGIVTSS